MESNLQNNIDAAQAATSLKVSSGGAVTTLVGWGLSSQIISLLGLLVALLGFIMAVYFNARRDRREQREYEARMKTLGAEP
jgi:hypothetical protein